MAVPTLVHEIIELMLLPALFIRLICFNRIGKEINRERILDIILSATSILLLISLAVVEKTTTDENYQYILLVIIGLFPLLFECQQMKAILKPPCAIPQYACAIAGVVSSSIKLFFCFLGIRTGLPLQYGICVVIVIDYFCIATVYFSLLRKTIPQHYGRQRLREGILRTLVITFILVSVAVPGVVLQNWRLSLESQLLVAFYWAVRHFAGRKIEGPVMSLTWPEEFPVSPLTVNRTSATYHDMLYDIQMTR